MHKHYRDYYWDEGKPCGIDPIDPTSNITYKIVSDPYHKHISIESYRLGRFESVIYDSKWLDFRHLKPMDQMAWQKEVINESQSLIRNQDDRIICKEIYRFEDNLCRECKTFSPFNILISTQKMFYTLCGDPFNGVILYDSNAHPVIRKLYAADASGTFTDLLQEQKSFKHTK